VLAWHREPQLQLSIPPVGTPALVLGRYPLARLSNPLEMEPVPYWLPPEQPSDDGP
jgi:hypothetical protein